MFRLYGRPDRSVKWKFCYACSFLLWKVKKKRPNAGVRSVGETVAALRTFRSELLFSILALYTELL